MLPEPSRPAIAGSFPSLAQVQPLHDSQKAATLLHVNNMPTLTLGLRLVTCTF